MLDYLIYIFCAVAFISVIGILLINNVFKAVLLLLVCLLALAGIYVLQMAEFVAVTQVLVYAGGIIVVLLFGIMLTTKMSGVPLKIENSNIFATILLCGSTLAILVFTFTENFDDGPLPGPILRDTVHETGMLLMTTYVLQFELAGILLLIALIGAAVISTTKTIRKPV